MRTTTYEPVFRYESDGKQFTGTYRCKRLRVTER
jgi:hypothetical protein